MFIARTGQHFHPYRVRNRKVLRQKFLNSLACV